MQKISLDEARWLAIQSQRLNHVPSFADRDAVLNTIEHLGYIQIDTLAVVQRAHHHALWSRVAKYEKKWLDELVNDRRVFEYWSHAASYLPMRDYRFSLIRKREYAKGKSHWFEQDKKIKRHVLSRIRREGPLQSKDFESEEKGDRTWYYWKPAKRALEQLFMEGKLMVSYRQGFQKVYDLVENVLPADAETKFPSKKEYAEHLVLSAVRSHGIVSGKEMYYQRGAWSEPVKAAIRSLSKNSAIVPVELEGHPGQEFHADQSLVSLVASLKPVNSIHFLSPFDNLVIQRKRMRQLFNFDYVIECYVPEHKRVFGYFTLPVLYGNQFIARMDAKADRATKIFYIRHLAFEPWVKYDDEMLSVFSNRLKDFIRFNDCEKLVVEKSNQKKWSAEILRMTRGKK